MADQADLDSFEVVIQREQTQYLAKLARAGLFAVGQTVAEAMDKLEKKKQDLRAELRAAGLDESVIAPNAPQALPVGAVAVAAPSTLGGIASFAGKLALLVVAIIVLGYAASFRLTMGGPDFWRRVESELARVADPKNDLPEAKKQELLSEIHVVVERWRPFVREAAGLFAPPSPSEAPHH